MLHHYPRSKRWIEFFGHVWRGIEVRMAVTLVFNFLQGPPERLANVVMLRQIPQNFGQAGRFQNIAQVVAVRVAQVDRVALVFRAQRPEAN